jgi:uncharacterized hydrophobic protein (TIGR00271 family)
VLRLRVSLHEDGADALSQALGGAQGIHRMVSSRQEEASERVVVSADVTPSAADEVLRLIAEHGIPVDDYLLVRQDAIAPSRIRPHGRGGQGFAWVELMGEARANSRPIGRYLALMGVAGVIAGLGVIKDNVILIVGAMALSPDLLPICATCVGLAFGRFHLAFRAFLTLLIGLALVTVTSAALGFLLDALGLLGSGFEVHSGAIASLAHVDYSIVIVAAAAGVGAMLSFETRAAAAVGVAISVTTIPASAYLGVAIAVDQFTGAGGALAVLVINVALLVTFGTLTLLAQHFFNERAEGAS